MGGVLDAFRKRVPRNSFHGVSKLNLWQSVGRPLMFCLPAERAHYVAMGLFSILARPSFIRNFLQSKNEVDDTRLETELFGLKFQNPIGLAAGFDKDARWYNELSALGFGHIEIGTLTGQEQPGNPKPRLFRLPRDRAIINRMGFNNRGSQNAARRLGRSIGRKRPDQVLGINIGKSKVVPIADADADYLLSFERLYEFADYFTLNVSSPNTPGLRGLQNRDALLGLLETIDRANESLAEKSESPKKPILLKIAPDLELEQLAEIAQIGVEQGLAGIIATNTTIARQPLTTPEAEVERLGAGGLSGAPLTHRSREVVRILYQESGGEIPIVGVGGIMNGDDAWQMILAGASLLQVFSGFIYGGPSTVKSMNSVLSERLIKNNLSSIKEAVGGAGKFD